MCLLVFLDVLSWSPDAVQIVSPTSVHITLPELAVPVSRRQVVYRMRMANGQWSSWQGGERQIADSASTLILSNLSSSTEYEVFARYTLLSLTILSTGNMEFRTPRPGKYHISVLSQSFVYCCCTLPLPLQN